MMGPERDKPAVPSHLQRVVVLFQKADDVVGDASGEMFENKLITLHARLLVVGVGVAPVVLLLAWRGGGGAGLATGSSPRMYPDPNNVRCFQYFRSMPSWNNIKVSRVYHFCRQDL